MRSRYVPCWPNSCEFCMQILAICIMSFQTYFFFLTLMRSTRNCTNCVCLRIIFIIAFYIATHDAVCAVSFEISPPQLCANPHTAIERGWTNKRHTPLKRQSTIENHIQSIIRISCSIECQFCAILLCVVHYNCMWESNKFQYIDPTLATRRENSERYVATAHTVKKKRREKIKNVNR